MSTICKPVFSVPVRELVDFVLRRGDLGGQGDFVGPARALAGIRGHQRLQRARPAGYRKEMALSHDVDAGELILRIQGRVDGLQATATEVVLEEIKTVQGRWEGPADPLHWAQAKVYGYIYTHDHALETITIQLTYLDLETGMPTEWRECFSRADLTSFFEETTAVYCEWIRARHAWCQLRDQSIRALEFPFPQYRPGQRDLAVAAYRALVRGQRLFLEAPTGIGKTMAVLFPALKVLAEGKLERLFYLTARTVGRTVAEKAFGDLRQAGLRLRTLTLTAKEKLCRQAGHPCDPRTCPLATGYYDRSKPAMRHALEHDGITRSVLESVSDRHQVCPFELSLDLSLWVDALVCDYNYVFDPKVYLRRHFTQETGPFGFLVDEAHNLVDRAREMFSADLHRRDIRDVRRALQGTLPRCAKALARLDTALRKLRGPGPPEAEPLEAAGLAHELDLFPTKPEGPDKGSNRTSKGESTLLSKQRGGVLATRDLPLEILPALEEALRETETWLARNQPAAFREDLLELYFRLQAFRRTAELYDERYVTLLEPGASGWVRLFCLDPSFLLRQALDRGRTALFFSATLTPADYYRSLLGGSSDDGLLQLPSPFPSENLAVLVHDRIGTHLRARTETLAQVVEAMGALVLERPGNYLVYLPSYQYLNDVQEHFQTLHPNVPILVQRPGMTETERDAFLAAFASQRGATLVGFAVLGGIFGEGIDLVGERLIGAVIVGVGLPQLCVERDLIGEYFQNKTGAGFDYAYMFPGMNRVLQAVGRIIRAESDRGVVLLIDTRFAQNRYRRLFPGWWHPTRVRNLADLRAVLRQTAAIP